MKKLTRILSMALCGAMVTALLAGCGGKKADAPKDDNAKPVLKVGMECAYAPYNWTQTDDKNGAVPIANSNGEFAYGYDVIVAKKLADAIGYDLEIYKTEWDGLPAGVAAGKIDAAIAGMSITADRLKSVDFTEPYYYASVVALTNKDSKYASAKTLNDLSGAKCTSQLNTIWYDLLNKIPSADIQPAMENVPAMIVSLSTKKVDLLVSDMPTCMAAVAANPNLVIVQLDGENPFGASQEDINIGIAIKKGNAELADKLNPVLKSWTEDDRKAMMEEAIKVQPMAQ